MAVFQTAHRGSIPCTRTNTEYWCNGSTGSAGSIPAYSNWEYWCNGCTVRRGFDSRIFPTTRACSSKVEHCTRTTEKADRYRSGPILFLFLKKLININKNILYPYPKVQKFCDTIHYYLCKQLIIYHLRDIFLKKE